MKPRKYLDIGGTKTEVVWIQNSRVKKKIYKTPKDWKKFKQLILQIKKESTIQIAIAGFIKNGIVFESKNLHFLKGKNLQKEFDCKIMNDTDSFALDQKESKGKYKNYVAITLGTGMGMGIVIGGNLYKGNGFAGEVGHVILKSEELEDIFSGRLLEEKYGIEKIPEELKNKKTYYHNLISELLTSIYFILHPEVIYLGGGLLKFFDMKILKEETKQKLPKFYKPKILKGKTKEEILKKELKKRNRN